MGIPLTKSENISVLFVCLGNICRSPTAHGVFENLAAQHGLADLLQVDSAGTGDWHLGKAPDSRTQAAALQQGYDLSHLRARQVTPADFDRFHYVLAMDANNLRDLKSMKPNDYRGHLGLFLDFATNTAVTEVPDPYYGGEDGFEEVLSLVCDASAGLLQHIQSTHFGR